MESPILPRHEPILTNQMKISSLRPYKNKNGKTLSHSGNGVYISIESNNFFSILKGQLLDLRQFLTVESPIKMIKNGFHFMLKALFFLRYLHFCTDFFVM